ncbi:MAG TPA: hypothetical protein VKA89_05585 [Solirubrobacterales bacterium]|nr:hypothetical protein [Solirubrobacterales bacterium]
MTRAGGDGGPADVEIGAAASARRIRFRRKPRTRVEFGGRPEIESDSRTERENLPEEVEPGEVYRDVRVSWAAGARIDDAEIRKLEEDIAARDRSKGAERSKES